MGTTEVPGPNRDATHLGPTGRLKSAPPGSTATPSGAAKLQLPAQLTSCRP